VWAGSDGYRGRPACVSGEGHSEERPSTVATTRRQRCRSDQGNARTAPVRGPKPCPSPAGGPGRSPGSFARVSRSLPRADGLDGERRRRWRVLTRTRVVPVNGGKRVFESVGDGVAQLHTGGYSSSRSLRSPRSSPLVSSIGHHEASAVRRTIHHSRLTDTHPFHPRPRSPTTDDRGVRPDRARGG
jgi:hypothetical protein